jgi:hypothetical protein
MFCIPPSVLSKIEVPPGIMPYRIEIKREREREREREERGTKKRGERSIYIHTIETAAFRSAGSLVLSSSSFLPAPGVGC